jgi:hypothetical protein
VDAPKLSSKTELGGSCLLNLSGFGQAGAEARVAGHHWGGLKCWLFRLWLLHRNIGVPAEGKQQVRKRQVNLFLSRDDGANINFLIHGFQISWNEY